MPVLTDDELYIRLMEQEDLQQVMQVEKASYDFCWTEKIFNDCLRTGYTCLVLADHDDVYGYCVLMMGANEAHVLNICVAEQFRGHGYARKMMNELMATAIAAECVEIYLEVRPSNPIALGLYQSMGFNEIGIRTNYYKSHIGREDAVVMGMALPLL